MQHCIWLGIVLALALSMAASAQPPNIVLILADDLGWNDVGFNAGEFYETPHLDRMARDGMIFANAYSSGPNCAPTRASLISGMYTPRHKVYTPGGKSKIDPRRMQLWVPVQQRFWERAGVTDPIPDAFEIRQALDPSVVSIAEVLKQAGYATARFGKWHVGPDTQGFDVSSSDGKPGTEKNHYNDPDVTFDLTDVSLDFIKENRDRPFFLYLSHWDVHGPLVARPNLVAKYERKLASWTRNENPYNPTYAAMVEAVDTSVGRVIDTLAELDLDERTLVIFSSDNGGTRTSINEPLRGVKGSLYEGGVRVPTCMKWPDVIAAGARSQTPIASVDFLPTFAELAGVSLPANQAVDGESFAPLLKGQPALNNRAIFWHYPLYLTGRASPASAIRKGDWKLLEFFEDGRVELYNVADNVSESNNLADIEPAKASELHQQLIAWRKSTNAVEPREPNPYYLETQVGSP
jgi:arylsulfatase A-like enzyme